MPQVWLQSLPAPDIPQFAGIQALWAQASLVNWRQIELVSFRPIIYIPRLEYNRSCKEQVSWPILNFQDCRYEPS
jgi:hypothetical protein